MANATEGVSWRYDLVSSLYSPGTVTAWYLTILSVFISWTLHRKKRTSGSIDVDFIAILVLPSVAAGHLISQVPVVSESYESLTKSGSNPDQLSRLIAAMEAPFVIVESFMPMSVALFLVAMWMQCLRRAVLTALIGCLCFGTECYIRFSEFRKLSIHFDLGQHDAERGLAFSRAFVADFSSLVIATLVILGASILVATSIITFFLQISKSQHTDRSDRERSSTARSSSDRDGRAVMNLSASSTFLLPAVLVLNIVPNVLTTIQDAYRNSVSNTKRTTYLQQVRMFAGNFYPHSNDSISNLDQAVATAAGATVFVFSIYSVIKSLHDERKDVQRPRSSI